MRDRPALLSTYLSLFLGRPSRRRLDGFRDRQLRRVVAHAYRRVPYYRDKFKTHGVHPDDIGGVRDLPRLPILERHTLQDEPVERMIADTVDPIRLGSIWSSGSSGTRIAVYRTRLESHVLNAVRMRAEQAIGRRRGMRLASIGLIRPRAHGDARSSWHRLAAAIGFRHARKIDCLQEPQRIIEDLCAEPVDMLGGFPGVLARVADHAGPGGLADLGVQLICTGGEVSTHDVRDRISRAFDAPVRQRYGSIEFNLLACQCPETDLLHVCEQSVIVEFLSHGRPVADDEPGEVVATGLHGYSMPLIRYRIGDVAAPGPTSCPCGAPCATIRSVQGRMIDFLNLPDGRVVHPWTLTVPMHGAHRWIGRYRLTQERLDRFVLEIVPRQTPTSDQLTDLEDLCRRTLGADLSVGIELIDDIPQEPSGKYRVVRSLVTPEQREDP